MKANQAIASALAMTTRVLDSYIADLSDEQLLEKPAEGCNPLAWQLGHLITSECQLLNMLAPGAAPELPAGFAVNHAREDPGSLNPANFCSREEYQALFDKVHAASLAALEKVTEEQLDAPAPEMMRERFPTMGDIWMLLALHGMMHAGQFVPVRRKLGKPVVI